MAVPAYRGTAQVRQPDGSYITLRLHGDEWMNFNTTVDGYSVVKDQRGYYVYAEKKNGILQSTSYVAHDVSKRSHDEQAFLAHVKKYQTPEMSTLVADMKACVETAGAQRRAQRRAAKYDFSKFKGLIVLVQFNDKEFSRPDYKDIITDMVNKKDYKGYDNKKMPGSVRDYFSDNSDGKFQPEFDVVGPYTLDFSQYDCNIKGEKTDEVLLAALDSVDVDVNFKDYDGDGDSMVDLVFFVMAGNGANFVGNDENLWWPHRAQIWNRKEYDKGRDPYVRKDGVLIWDYASSTELAGYTNQPSSIYIDGIGTICHEFSHVLGLPDFYDSNYEDDGESITPGDWSLMAQGCYLDNGFTPAGYSLYERYSVGFTDEPEKIAAEGSYTLDPLHLSQTGFRIDSPEKNEFFLFENRQNGQFKWDAYLPGHGLLVHRVDMSDTKVWQENKVNANAERNYYELIRAGGPENANTNYDVFPGRGKVTTLHNGTKPANLKTWSGKAAKWGLFNIREDNGVVSFDVQNVLTLSAVSLPESAEVGVDFSIKLTAQLTPIDVKTTLKWASSNERVATVNQQGLVTGLSVGECIVSVTSDNGLSDSCKISVESLPVVNIDELKRSEIDSRVILSLSNAVVLYAYDKTTYLRDESGCIKISNADLGLNRYDCVTGSVYGLVGNENNMMQLVGIDAVSSAGNFTISGSKTVQPREVTLEELTEQDYADYVLVKAVQLERNNGVWAVSGSRRVRLSNLFQIQGINVPMNITGKYYDIEAIYGTNILNGEVIDELYRTAKLVEVEAPTGIVELWLDDADINRPLYNLQGQRVSPTAKGLLIRGGRKLLNR